jgi:TrmH family RNA methyltransferase
VAVFHSLSSPSNPLLKDVRRAILRGSLTDDGLCAAESFHLLREALASGRPVKTVIAAESAEAALARTLRDRPEQNVALVPDRLFQTLSAAEASQGVIALVEPPEWPLEALFNERSLVVVLDAIQDPGNAGTIVRAAEAFGASGVIFVKGTASPFNAKTLRASAGSLFRVPFRPAVEPSIARAALERNRLQVYAAMPGGGSAPEEAALDVPCAIVAGNEGRGVSDEFRSGAISIAIPTAGVESLNASIAAAILLYEAQRQRRRTT